MLQGYPRFLIVTLPLLLSACESMPKYQVPVVLEPYFSDVLPQKPQVLNQQDYLEFYATALSPISLHKIYEKGEFRYAHFYCPIDEQLDAKGFISVSHENQDLQTKNLFKYDVSFEICAKHDASKRECVYQFQQLHSLPKQLTCKIIFGRLLGGRTTIAKNIKMDISQLEHAKKYTPPEFKETK